MAPKQVDFAVAAGEEELEGVGGEVLDGSLGEVEALEFGEVVGGDDVAAVEAEVAGGGEEAGAAGCRRSRGIRRRGWAGALVVGGEEFGVKAVVGFDAGDGGEMRVVLGMEVQEGHDGRGVVDVELNVVLVLDEQGNLRRKGIAGHTDKSRIRTWRRCAGTVVEMRLVCGGAALAVGYGGFWG